MITIFKSVKDISTPFFVSVDYVFEKIRSGSAKDLVKKIRNEQNKSDRNQLKLQLPAICFSGEFKTRNKNGLIKHSGLICLDFDSFDTLEALNAYKSQIKENEYTYSCFISPSGNGLKVVVKIPQCTSEEHEQYFVALCDAFNIPNLDTSTKDVSRVTYASYDPDIYINPLSKVWDIKEEFEHKEYSKQAPVLKLTSSDAIIDRLLKWFNRKYGIIQGNRNNNLFIFGCALNEYGIPFSAAEDFCFQYEMDGFTRKEITTILKSSYSKSEKHGIKYFDDKNSIDFIKRLANKGNSSNEIAEKLQHKNIPADVLNNAIKEISEELYTDTFWTKSDKGKLTICHNKFKKWLSQNGFNKYYADGQDTFIYVYKENNLVDITNENKIKDYVMNYLDGLEDISVYEHMAGRTSIFKDSYLNLLENINIVFKEDTEDAAYIYFKNAAIEVSKKGLKQIDYLELDGFIWKKHIINTDFEKVDFKGCDFEKFIWNISGQNADKEISIKTTIGYLLHSYKNSASNFAIILNDEMISENPNGGTGKGILINAINKLKRCAIIDGKTFSFDKSFPYQTVSSDTQIIVFDDVRKNFNFENLFSIVTEGITLERKNKDAIKIPIDKSPKVLISTNYAIGGDGSSFERRKWDIELSQHYNIQNTPLKEFGRLLFDQWDGAEWMKFYNYMLDCLSLYLKNGLIRVNFNNTKLRAFIAATCSEFSEWTSEGHIQINYRYNKKEMYDMFIKEYPDRKMIHQKTFNKWVKTYSNQNGHFFKEGHSNGQRWFEIKDREDAEIKIVETDEMPF